MDSNSKQKVAVLRDYEQFEVDAINIISKAMPNFDWQATKLTRDGNKDATGLFQSEYLDSSFIAWLEVKYRTNPNMSIVSRAFDSTLISALDESSLKALYLITNAKISTKLQYRVEAFFERVMPNLQTVKLYGGNYLKLLKNCPNNTLDINDLVSLEVRVVNCVDFSNCKLNDIGSVNSNEFNYIVISFFNPFSVSHLNEVSKPVLSLLKNENIIKEHAIEDGWNYMSFLFTPEEREIANNRIELFLSYNDKSISLVKELLIYNFTDVSLSYRSSLQLSSTITNRYELILKGQSRRLLALISGSAGCGKTYILENSCANWSKTHEIQHIRFTGLQSDWEKLADLLIFSFDSNWNSEREVNELDESADIETIVEGLIKNQKLKYKKLILIDDWQKASPNVIIKSVDIISSISKYTENVSLLLFSRPCYSFEEIKSALQGFEFYELTGPSFEDTKNSMRLTFEQEHSNEDVRLVFELAPNIISLIKCLELIKSAQLHNEEHSIRQIVNQLNHKNLFELPTLDKNELDLICIIYNLPNGIKYDDLSLEEREVAFRLSKNGLVKVESSYEQRYIPIHDLLRESVLSRHLVLSDKCISRIKILAKRSREYYYAYLSLSVSNSQNLNSAELKEARKIRDQEVDRTHFGLVHYLSEAIINTALHSQSAIDRLECPSDVLLVAFDFFQAGNIANHTSYNKAATTYLEQAYNITKRFLYCAEIKDLFFRIQSELINIRFWNLDCSFINKLELTDIEKESNGNNRALAKAIILNRKMMAHYLLDEYELAKSTRVKASKFCTKYGQNAEKIHLTMDSAKSEMVTSPKTALRLFTTAINKYEENDFELRRLLVARYQRESLRVKLGKSKAEYLYKLSEDLKLNGFNQEYINSIIDLATIYAVNKQNQEAAMLLNSVSAHPDFELKPRLVFKVKQCKAVIKVIELDLESAGRYWEEVLNTVTSAGNSYKNIPSHNLRQDSVSSINWFFEPIQFIEGEIYVDPRLW
ncbi:hypothetical protein N480_19100 [Pseudoalteromonas luteoviolacea S2607]|uniref:hypothetical protein n=1 Tax=Pseudoalteromonas luteoviolacea TaxID=43657 RepID=UPI0007B0B9E6|nr:hypothetical protein [Pseudoalteromonas luteoviolacea]KZN35728.1 hypothetical protein N480_19100 [Pseudoalteromonas luteoviolacea S2607]